MGNAFREPANGDGTVLTVVIGVPQHVYPGTALALWEASPRRHSNSSGGSDDGGGGGRDDDHGGKSDDRSCGDDRQRRQHGEQQRRKKKLKARDMCKRGQARGDPQKVIPHPGSTLSPVSEVAARLSGMLVSETKVVNPPLGLSTPNPRQFKHPYTFICTLPSRNVFQQRNTAPSPEVAFQHKELYIDGPSRS